VSMARETLLACDGLRKRYGGVTAVDGVSAGVAPGEFVSFVGPSGCGKTTLLRLLGGFIRPDAGRVVLDGVDITTEPPNRRATAMVFQSYALFPHLSVADNVGYALKIRGRPRAEIARRVEELLALVRLEGLGARRPDQLSGGQQQRVALARALSLRPKVLLLDEPLSNLDANLRVLMRSELKRLQRDLALTVVYVTHDQEEAMSISDRIAVMRAGRLEQVGAPADLYERPATEFVAAFVGPVDFLDGELAPGANPGEATVRTAVGTLAVRATPAGLGPGAAVRLVLRPEAVRLAPPEEAGRSGAVAGTVEQAVYTGALVRYAVDVGGLRLAANLHDPRHGHRYREGDRVTLVLPPDVHILPAPGAAATEPPP
jgi:spermidine/putrescine ABC transporter ATP-binding subunit